jgi:formamidopyrimidine-DNA glycosylase
MPELPEVETIVSDLRPLLTGRRIMHARLSHADVLDGIGAADFTTGLIGRTITGMTRRAKHAVTQLDDGRRFIVQPGMSGVLVIADGAPAGDDLKYAVLRAVLDDGRELVYRDVRRLGTLRLLDDTAWADYEARLGPEPLDPALDADAFWRILRRTKQALKKAIMDQRVLVGVGNIYANEALFLAGLDPSQPADSLTRDEAALLLAETKRILAEAIAARGTTFRDYRTGTGQTGGHQHALWVYGREGEPCRRCGTRLAFTHAIDARGTVFCHRCQR